MNSSNEPGRIGDTEYMKRYAVAAGLVLLTAGCGATATAAPAAPAAPEARAVDTISWYGFGGDPANDRGGMIGYSYKGDVDQPGWISGVGLPFAKTDQVTHQPWNLAMRVIGSPGEKVQCTISVNEVAVDTQTGTGIANCHWQA